MKILGLDLGTTSIGWALINEDENIEKSSIIKLGTRIIQYDNFSKVDKTGVVSESKDPAGDFMAGRGLSPNADRTKKRGARRMLDRYQLRRKNLLKILKEQHIIDDNFIYAEDFKESTFHSYKIRSQAAEEEISLSDFAKVLLMINKKRGYKSSRKAKSEDEGMTIDGMAIAKEMYENELTPGQYVLSRLEKGMKFIPDFYRSDLQNEFDKIWTFQQKFHPEILTEDFKVQLHGQGLANTKKIFLGKYKIYTADIKGKDKQIESYKYRVKGLKEKLEPDVLALVIVDINNNLNKSSGYLGAISDRSKELYFNRITVGQYQYKRLKQNPHNSLKNQVFYRQDYLDEFEKIWTVQSKFNKALTEELKNEIRDVVIFYQRKLKSQKHLISFCEYEKHHRVIPKSNLLFQEFKIWQRLNDLKITNKNSKEEQYLDLDCKNILFKELNIKGRLTKKEVIEALGYKDKDYELNFKEIEGNNTNESFYEAFQKMFELDGHYLDLTANSKEIKSASKTLLEAAHVDTRILDFDAEISGDAYDKQSSMQLWHLLYASEEDKEIIKTLLSKYGFPEAWAKILTNVHLQQDHGSLSSRAIRKILPFLREGKKYSEACAWAGYNHSSSMTKEESANKPLDNTIELLNKNSLRNPVVEKILNQMIHIVNQIISHPDLGRPDEIRIELARELKKSAKERSEMTANIGEAKSEHEKIIKIIQAQPFNIKNPTKNDIIRYKLYDELSTNGYKTLYSNTYIAAEELYSKNFDVEHIIPKSKLFDDSFSNKTIELRDVNIKKGNATAFDFISTEYESNSNQYLSTIEKLYNDKIISRAKYKKLLMKEGEIPSDFIERDIRDTQYIAKKAKELLEKVVRTVNSTTGSITDRLREDWGLTNIMQELNYEKYKTLGLTTTVEKKDGTSKEVIIDWSKRNDHRHHAMDALTVAFTKPAYIQYLNNLNAKDEGKQKEKGIYGIEAKYTEKIKNGNDNRRVFKLPLPNFRTEAKEQLENILISFKAKNKVVTKNKNKVKTRVKGQFIIQDTLTPRGQLHKETVYGKIKQNIITEEKIDGKFTQEKIDLVCNPNYKRELQKRLIEYGNDSKKAFTGKNSLSKNPIKISSEENLPEKVKVQSFEDEYTIRKEVTPDLKIEKVIDEGIKRVLQKRLIEYGNDPKKAFVELDKNPIWLNKEKGIAIKSVRITGVKNVEPLHHKVNHLGKDILDDRDNSQGNDFVSTGNNHHVAIYRDQEGNLQDEVVSLFEAVSRVNQSLPVIKTDHEKGWQFLFTMKQNECFVFPNEEFDPKEINLFDPNSLKVISKNMYRVQTLSRVEYGNAVVRDFKFRHHIETTVQDKKELANIAYKQIKSLSPLEGIVKVRINHLGMIIHAGE